MDRHWGPRLEKGSGRGGVSHLEDKEVSIVWDLVGRRVVLACVSPSPEYEGFSIYVSCRQIALLSSKDLPVGDIYTLICGLALLSYFRSLAAVVVFKTFHILPLCESFVV